MQMLGSFAEFERDMVRERTRAGAEIARIFRVAPHQPHRRRGESHTRQSRTGFVTLEPRPVRIALES